MEIMQTLMMYTFFLGAAAAWIGFIFARSYDHHHSDRSEKKCEFSFFSYITIILAVVCTVGVIIWMYYNQLLYLYNRTM